MKPHPIIVALTGAALAFPATALGANPDVVRIDPATGKQTVLAGGGNWTTLTGIAAGPKGSIYVSDLNSGISSLTAPKFAVKGFFASAPNGAQYGLVASGTSLYALDPGGVTRHDAVAPFSAQAITDGWYFDDVEADMPPRSAALSGPTLYVTAFSSCDSVVGEGGAVVAVDIASGNQSLVKSKLGCDEPQGIAAAPDGTLLIALRTSEGAAQIVKLNPATGKRTTLSAGRALKDPRGLALESSGDLVVADATSGVLRVSTRTGAQSKIASGPALGGANAVALDASGTIYVAAAGPSPVVKASAAPQRLSSGAVRIRVSCRPRCAISYFMDVAISDDPGFSENGDLEAVGAARTLKFKLEPSVKKRIATALRHKGRASVKMTLTPHIPGTDAPGKPISVSARFTR